MESRNSYLFFILREVKEFFQQWVDADFAETDISFSAQGCQLRLDVPIGVLFDTVVKTKSVGSAEDDGLPFKLTVQIK